MSRDAFDRKTSRTGNMNYFDGVFKELLDMFETRLTSQGGHMLKPVAKNW